MKMLVLFFRKNIEEIQVSLALRWYGVFLALTHLLTFIFWSVDGNVAKIFSSDTPVCWTFNPYCESLRPFPEIFTKSILSIFLLVSILAAVFFLIKRFAAWAYYVFAVASLLKLLILAQDYRLMGNYHYMSNILILIFLFVPQKINFLKYFIVGFYIAAGLIKFNMDWLNGYALLRPSILSGKLLSAALVYIIFLELLGSWFLLSKRLSVFIFFILQFLIFHIFSWHIVGYFYPCTMFCLLSIFILERVFPTQTSMPKRSSLWGWAALAVFTICQFIPLLFYTDSAITGKGRLISLNMLDARAICENKVFIRDHEVTYQTSLTTSIRSIRVRCDPLVYAYEGKALCRKLRVEQPLADLDIALYSRRSSDNKFTEVLKLQDVCSRPLQISFLGEIQ